MVSFFIVAGNLGFNEFERSWEKRLKSLMA